MARNHAANAALLRVQARNLRAGGVDCPEIARRVEKVTSYPSPIAVSGVRLVCRQLNIVYIPLRFELAQLLLVDELHIDSNLALHRDVELQSLSLVWVHDPDKSRLPKVSRRSHRIAPGLEHAQADQSQFD